MHFMGARAWDQPAEQPPSFRADRPELIENVRGADDDAFGDVLRRTVDALDAADVPYAVIGGIASSGFGRPRWTHDIDVFVKPEDASRALDALDAAGFATERTDSRWIFKAFSREVMVDIIFRSTGGFYFDREMLERAVHSEFQGHPVRLVPPEDLLIMKAVVHDEPSPRHWHDALGVLAGADIDWDYLERRALRAPRRVLSLLVYAHSLDLYVPMGTIRRLFEKVYGD